jgi:hypothetical protein
VSDDVNPYQSPWGDLSDRQPFDGGPIRVQVELTLDEAGRVFDHLGGRLGITLWGFGLVTLWLAVLGGTFIIHSIAVRSSQPGMYVVVGIICLLGVVAHVGFIVNVRQSRTLRRLHAQRDGIFRPTQWDITEEGMACSNGTLERSTSWDDYAGYRITANIFLFHLKHAAWTRQRRATSKGRFNGWRNLFVMDLDAVALLPRAQFGSDEDWHKLLFLVRRKLKKI